jgi:RNA polymerase primary sigma factor
MRDDGLRGISDSSHFEEKIELEVNDQDEAPSGSLLNQIVCSQEPEADFEPTVWPDTEGRSRQNPFLLESLYFRSFRGTALLTKKEELDLAKHIDDATRRIRMSLKNATALLAHAASPTSVKETIQELSAIRRLSGLSAIALDRADTLLSACAGSTAEDSLVTPEVRQQLLTVLADIRVAGHQLEDAKEELVRRNLRLVVDVAKRYTTHSLTLLDLVQEGNIGLMKAAERYQYRKGFKFSTYATWWIRQGITRALAEQSRVIRVPVHQCEAASRIARATRRLELQLGEAPRIEDIARTLGLRPDRVRTTLAAIQKPLGLETPVGDGQTVLGELIPDDHTAPPDSSIHRLERENELERLLSQLSPRENAVIRMRFGLGYDKMMTLVEVGEQLDLSRERVRQIEAHALSKLNTPTTREVLRSIQ